MRYKSNKQSCWPGLFIISGVAFLIINAAYSQSRPNILWIVAEDISPMFGCYDVEDGHTPYIDQLAKRSLVYKRAYSTAPICSPSRSCLATGMYATSLGSQHLRSEIKLPDSIKPMAKVFKENGYWTALRNKTDYNFSANGLFDYWKSDTAPWKKCPEGKPFFAFMNLGSTHEGSGNIPEKADKALANLSIELRKNPDTVELPPYFPDTKEMRRIWARYLDLITVFDRDVKAVLEQLKKDGQAENTIVFIMSDHGMGLPRYKRWLYLTGLHVPLIVHLPEKFKHLSPYKTHHQVIKDITSYVHLPATALNLADIEIPQNFEGKPLLGANAVTHNEFVFGARDRADDMLDLSRCVFDGRYLYIRHYLPHLAPMQEGYIMSDVFKESHIELHRVHRDGQDSQESKKLWSSRPYEELYDLKNDPKELNNIAHLPKYSKVKQKLKERLKQWSIETRDSGFLTEPEMHARSKKENSEPYLILQNPDHYPIEEVVAAADLASTPNVEQHHLQNLYHHKDSAVRFWSIQGHIIQGFKNEAAKNLCLKATSDSSKTVQAVAAEGLARMGYENLALPVFKRLLKEKEPNLALYIARCLATSTKDIKPLEQEIRQARSQYLSEPGAKRKWKDFVYSAFTCWALEWSLVKSGLNTFEDFK